MEDLIVYGTVIVILIINFIRNYQKELKKNKDKALSRQQTPQPNPTTEDYPETTYSHSQNIINKREKNYRTEFNSYTTPSGYIYTDQMYEEGESAFQNTINNDLIIDDEKYVRGTDTEKEGLDLQLNTSEDLKKAFIYTLIFDRKY